MPVVREPDAEPIPGYRLIEPLGSGGFGEVWKCEAPGGIFKAVKFVYGNHGLDASRARASDELDAIQRIKAIRHPFLLSIDRVECVDGEFGVGGGIVRAGRLPPVPVQAGEHGDGGADVGRAVVDDRGHGAWTVGDAA